MNDKLLNIRKKLFANLICVIICAIALVALTLTRYTTDTMEGSTRYEPALFNTVLLGKLVNEDIENLESMEDGKYYKIVDGALEVNQKVSGQKLAYSLSLSESTSLSGGADATISKLGPGEKEVAYIYFTVTNGTTVVDDIETNTWRVKNIAETDVRYTLHILSTNNLPLKYQLYELAGTSNVIDANAIEFPLTDLKHPEAKTTGDTGTGSGDTGSGDTGSGDTGSGDTGSGDTGSGDTGSGDTGSGTATPTTEAPVVLRGDSDYVVKDSVPAEGQTSLNTIFYNGARLLKSNDDSSVTVHRYVLKVTWPGTGTSLIGDEAVRDNDLSYMKELENVQILVEVESYVNHVKAGSDVEMIATGVMVPSKTASIDSMYTVSSDSGLTLNVDKVVRYDNMVSATIDPEDTTDPTWNTYTYQYTLDVCNGDSISAQWVADDAEKNAITDPLDGTGSARKNDQTPKSGHYIYNVDFTDGTYQVLIAVPNGTINASEKDRSQGVTYYMHYGDTWYQGADTGKTIDTVESKRSNVKADEFVDETVAVYKILRFTSTVPPEEGEDAEILTVTLDDEKFQREEMTLYMTGDTPYEPCKDDFRIYLSVPES